MKGYRLWCIQPSSYKFIINKDVTFDEKALLHSRKESIATNKDYSVHKQLELEVRSLVYPLHGYASVQPVQDDQPKIIDETNVTQEQQYTIATRRLRR